MSLQNSLVYSALINYGDNIDRCFVQSSILIAFKKYMMMI